MKTFEAPELNVLKIATEAVTTLRPGDVNSNVEDF